MNIYDTILIILNIVLAAVLAFLAFYAEKNKVKYWRCFYLVPGLLCLMALMIAGFDACLIPLCIGVISALAGFVKEDKKIRLIVSGTLLTGTLLTLVLALTVSGYRFPNYTKNFNDTVDELEERYVLTKHKNIDFEALREEFEPRFREAEKNKDEVMNSVLWYEFVARLNDGHVGYSINDNMITDEALDYFFGNDFGFATIQLSDGSLAAVNVDKNTVPFVNGTKIISIDGKNPEDIIEEKIQPLFSMPVLENEIFYKSMMLGGSSSETMEVTYIDEDGSESNVTLASVGRYYERFEDTVMTVDQGANIGTLTFTETDDHTCLYRIKQMMQDTKTYGTSDYSELKESVRTSLEDYKNKGYDKLVIDLRSNGGGDPFMDLAIVSLLAPEGEHYYCSTGVVNEDTNRFIKDENGDYIIGENLTYTGENIWGEGEIVILTNGECVSAGDHFIKMMKGYPNVTVVGFTCSNSSGQAVRALEISDKEQLSYSAVPAMNEDGSVYVDAGADRESAVGIDVIVPMDEKAVKALFDEGKDYILDTL